MSETQILKFRVRSGLVVHRERSITEQRGRATVSRAERVSFGAAFGNPIVELLPDEVRSYAHALEPVPVQENDPASVQAHEAGAKALAALHHRPPAQSEQPDLIMQVAAASALAVLKALGITVPAVKRG